TPGDQWLAMPAANYIPAAPAANLSNFLSPTSSPLVPTWTDGSKYRLQARSLDGIAHLGFSSDINFIYDISRPTVAATAPVMSVDSLNPNWLNSVPALSGTITDNVVDVLNIRAIYTQVKDLTTGTQFMDASSAFITTNAVAGNSYMYIPVNTTGDTWARTIAGLP
ncbi:MAG: hypothetical protein COV48_11995, partial [Elusimicrobia bacterium CG11_big_fil_rev_8_21_14_0_20_64_6]